MKRIKRKDNTNKKILLLLSFIFLIISLSTIKNTYAKYITSASGDANIQIARWKILINNQDVVEQKEITNVITPIFEGTNHIASNVIAPTAEGYFDILIDATNTDVSLKYEVTTNNTDESDVSDLEISAYSIDNGEKQEIDTTTGQIKIENQILYNDTDKDIKLRVYLKWNDDETTGATMNNKNDTEATIKENSLAKVKINLKFTQLPNTN